MRTRTPNHRVIRDFFETDISVDLFAGGGGASTGTEAATGRAVDIAINHDEVAIAVHALNHPETEHYRADVFKVDPTAACRGRHVRHLHASPDCRHHSRAAGGKPKSDSVRSLADVVIVWAEKVKPDVITLENVAEFEDWGPLTAEGKPNKERKGETFRRWKRDLQAVGYVVEHRVLHAHHYGAPTSRKRFFLVARIDGLPIVWPAATHGPGLKPFRTAAECIDWSIPCPSIFERKKPLAEKTLRRVAAGVVKFVLNNPRPFIVQVPGGAVAPTLIQTGYGEREGQAPRVLDLHKPMGTLVAQGQKHALVSAFLAKHYGGVVGQDLRKPIGTITAVDHHSPVTVTLAESGGHAGEVRAFLTTYFGSEADIGQDVRSPLRTITTRDRFGLVTVEIDGTTYAIVDIGLRMLEPHELLKAQFGRFASQYDLSAALTKKDKVRLIGNSVCPEMQEAVCKANLPRISPTRKRPGARPTPVRRAA